MPILFLAYLRLALQFVQFSHVATVYIDPPELAERRVDQCVRLVLEDRGTAYNHEYPKFSWYDGAAKDDSWPSIVLGTPVWPVSTSLWQCDCLINHRRASGGFFTTLIPPQDCRAVERNAEYEACHLRVNPCIFGLAHRCGTVRD